MLNPNLHSCLQFISGLGSVRAADFIEKYLTYDLEDSFRKENTILPKNVHKNAVGFINAAKSASKYSKLGNKVAKSIDGTRIHPDFYFIANKMAKAALGEDQEDADLIPRILKDPSKLRQLDLEQFSQNCKKVFNEDYKSFFYFIKDELESPFRDIREEYSEYENKIANQESNLFYMLTGESPQTFFEGLLVSVTINKSIGNDGFSCKSISKSSWSGFIPKSKVDD